MCVFSEIGRDANFNGECDFKCLMYGLDERPADVLFFACLQANLYRGAGVRSTTSMQGCVLHVGLPRTSSHAAYLFVICMCFLLVHLFMGG